MGILPRKPSSLLTWISLLILGNQATFSQAVIFSKEPKSLQIPVGYTADILFDCRAGDELTNPIYEWLKNGKRLDIDSESRYNLYGGDLSISEPQSSDAGKYRCVITSDEGKASTNNVELTFEYLVQPTSNSEETVRVPQSTGVELKCDSIQYSPEFSVYYVWEKTADFSTISAYGTPTHFISQTTGSLFFANAQPMDSATYQCKAISVWMLNGVSKRVIANTVSLTVESAIAEYAPKLMVKPADVKYVELNGRTFLECFASGNPTPKITWTKDGSEEIPRSAKLTKAGQLFFEKIGEDAEGTYTCTATNAKSSVSASGKLVLNYPPRWNNEIKSVSSDLNSKVKWNCSTNAVPMATYAWWKNEEKIIPAINSSLTIEEEEGYSTLTVVNLNPEDSGIYQCVATNSLGDEVSAAKLVVNSYPPSINPQVLSITYGGLGSKAVIDCTHTAAPAAEITWNKEGTPLQTGEKYEISETASLTIKNVAEEDVGKYTCKLSNVLGETESSGNLKAYELTEITKTPDDVQTTARETVKLLCDEYHDSALVMTWIWKHDGKRIPIFDTQYTTNGGELMINSVTSKQSGTYTCCAETKVNTPCASASVYVTAPPNRPENVRVTSSSATSQVLKWTAPFDNHSPIQSYSIEYRNSYDEAWKMAITEKRHVNVTECLVKNLNPYNDYMYRVYATNELGISEPSEESPAQSTNKGAPVKAPRRIRGGGGSIGQLVVAWQPLKEEYYGEDKIQYVIAIQKIPDGEPSHLPIPDFNSTDEEVEDEEAWMETTVDGWSRNHTFSVGQDEVWAPYNVKIKAVNSIGDGPWSHIKIVHTFEIKPDTKPSNLKEGRDKQSTWADLQWDALYSKNGRVLGYVIQVEPKAGPNMQVEMESTRTGAPVTRVKGLSPNTVYTATVAGYNGAGQGPWSDPLTFHTTKKPPSVAPTGVKVSIKNNEISAMWNPIIYKNQQPLDEELLKGYKVQYWWSNKTSAFAKSLTTTHTSMTFTVADNSRYNVWVMGYSAGGDGIPSQLFPVSTESTLAPGSIHCCGANTVKFNSVIIMVVTLLWMLFIKLDL